MFWDKKGDFKYGNLAKIILALIIGIILISFTPILLQGSQRGVDIATCLSKISLQSSLKDPALGIKLKDIETNCVTFQNEIKGDKFEIYETLAKGMHDTWKMYGQGKIDFFSDWDWGKKDSYCFIGDEIKITNKVKEEYLDIDGFEEYLSNYYPPNSQQTYAEFLTGAKNTKLDFGLDNIPLTKNNKLYVLFTVVKKNAVSPSKGAFFAVGGCATGGKIGAGIGGIIGFFGGAGVGALPAGAAVAGIGCAIGTIITGVSYATGYADELYPGILLISSENLDTLQEKCDGGLHYNPK